MKMKKRASSDRSRSRPRRRRVPRGPDPSELYWFDAAAADRACEFFPRFLRHTKGEWAGRPFELAEWQKDRIIRPLFGWKRRADGLRRYRSVYVEVPRKNGKSQLAAGLALYLLHCDNEPGAEIYSAAKDRFQAAIIYDEAKKMCAASPVLKPRTERYRRNMLVPSTASVYQVLSADVETKEGLNPHGILFDELHVQDDRRLWDVLRMGIGARRQPVIFATTTAGFDRKSLCAEFHDKALKVLSGVVRDDAFLPVVYGIEEGEDWEDRDVWARVNPNLGISLRMDQVEQEYLEARESPGFENTFRRYRLCEWVQQAVRWINQKKWKACAGATGWREMEERLRGRPCFAGLDLSTVTDLSALVLVFDSSIAPGAPDYPTEEEFEEGRASNQLPGVEYGDPLPMYDVLCRFWCPEEGIRIRSRKDKVGYDLWAKEGALTPTEGDAVDHGAIRKEINDLGERFLIQEIAVDAWNAHKLITELENEDGFTIARMSQGFGAMNAPTKALDSLYLRRQVRHGGHPVLSWCADNASLDKDAYDNWKVSKKKSRERIDGMVALVMALARSLVSTGSVHDVRIETLG